VELVEEGSIILDAFTGYGAIALNIAHKKGLILLLGMLISTDCICSRSL